MSSALSLSLCSPALYYALSPSFSSSSSCQKLSFAAPLLLSIFGAATALSLGVLLPSFAASVSLALTSTLFALNLFYGTSYYDSSPSSSSSPSLPSLSSSFSTFRSTVFFFVLAVPLSFMSLSSSSCHSSSFSGVQAARIRHLVSNIAFANAAGAAPMLVVDLLFASLLLPSATTTTTTGQQNLLRPSLFLRALELGVRGDVFFGGGGGQDSGFVPPSSSSSSSSSDDEDPHAHSHSTPMSAFQLLLSRPLVPLLLWLLSSTVVLLCAHPAVRRNLWLRLLSCCRRCCRCCCRLPTCFERNQRDGYVTLSSVPDVAVAAAGGGSKHAAGATSSAGNRPGPSSSSSSSSSLPFASASSSSSPQQFSSAQHPSSSSSVLPPDSYNYFDPDELPPRLSPYRELVYAACEEVGNFFGFQDASVRNQAEHLLVLASNGSRRKGTSSSSPSSPPSPSLSSLHGEVFQNYRQWCKSLCCVPIFCPSSLSALGPSGSQSLDLATWFCIWGECANLRHMPECLCFLYHTAMRSYVCASPQTRLNRSLYQGHYLDNAVSPIYDVVKKCMASSLDHEDRRNYDDLNEFFWKPSCLEYNYKHPEPPASDGAASAAAAAASHLSSYYAESGLLPSSPPPLPPLSSFSPPPPRCSSSPPFPSLCPPLPRPSRRSVPGSALSWP